MKLVRPPAKPTHRVRAEKLDKKMLKQIRETLESEQADLRRQLDELDSAAHESSQTEATGEAGMNQDFADAGTATFDRERDFSIRNNIQDLVDQMGTAMSRIDDGTYGTCERCGKPIDAARLRALASCVTVHGLQAPRGTGPLTFPRTGRKRSSSRT